MRLSESILCWRLVYLLSVWMAQDLFLACGAMIFDADINDVGDIAVWQSVVQGDKNRSGDDTIAKVMNGVIELQTMVRVVKACVRQQLYQFTQRLQEAIAIQLGLRR